MGLLLLVQTSLDVMTLLSIYRLRKLPIAVIKSILRATDQLSPSRYRARCYLVALSLFTLHIRLVLDLL
jgi:hypothetical protein